jgi:hypothetical protein
MQYDEASFVEASHDGLSRYFRAAISFEGLIIARKGHKVYLPRACSVGGLNAICVDPGWRIGNEAMAAFQGSFAQTARASRGRDELARGSLRPPRWPRARGKALRLRRRAASRCSSSCILPTRPWSARRPRRTNSRSCTRSWRTRIAANTDSARETISSFCSRSPTSSL